jgi:hypothetical protein
VIDAATTHHNVEECFAELVRVMRGPAVGNYKIAMLGITTSMAAAKSTTVDSVRAGDPGVGKSSLLHTFVFGRAQEDYGMQRYLCWL